MAEIEKATRYWEKVRREGGRVLFFWLCVLVGSLSAALGTDLFSVHSSDFALSLHFSSDWLSVCRPQC